VRARAVHRASVTDGDGYAGLMIITGLMTLITSVAYWCVGPASANTTGLSVWQVLLPGLADDGQFSVVCQSVKIGIATD
jgi:hypothetical protein